MDAATPTSCILCYEADELGSMVQVEFGSRDGLRVTRVVLCRRCAQAISAALAQVLEDDGQSEHERNFDRAMANGGFHRPADDWGASRSEPVDRDSDPEGNGSTDPDKVDE
jgi:hypothetical protein